MGWKAHRLMDFEAAYPAYRREIKAMSRRAFLDLDPDDVAQEMTVALWKATLTYNDSSGTPFGAYWWSVWKNRRADLAERYFAQKRVHADLWFPTASVLDGPVEEDRMPLPPPGTALSGQQIWRLLASGSPGVEARSLAEMTKRAYYAQVEAWRTEEVRDWIRRDDSVAVSVRPG